MEYKKDSSIRKRQSFVAKSGREWENQVMQFLNQKLKKSNIRIITGNEIKQKKEDYKKLWRHLTVPTKESDFKFVWGDMDLVALNEKNYPVAVISCKTSLHGRFTETLFYSLLFKLLTQTKVVLATSDKGRGAGKWQSEWGTQEKPTKDRQLASSYIDGVYVLNPRTKLGGIVRSLEELPNDLLHWAKDLKRYE